ncbi:MAG: glycoside hydrolase family 5 protein, partial [Chitinophagaceae bacterium]
ERKIKDKINGGVNISLFEQYWSSKEVILNTNLKPKIEKIAALGFKSVRLPVAFDLFLENGSTNLPIALIDKIGETYNYCLDYGLALTITYHYGKLTDTNGFTERDKILWIWKQMQLKFKGMGYESLFFELYNEPTIQADNWRKDIQYIVNGLRVEDENRYYIIGGTNYNNLNELPQLGKLSDKKLLYCFHFYEPYLFTHQGAEWTSEKSYMTGLPYPYKRRKMPKMASEAKGTIVEENYKKYDLEATKEYMFDHIRKIESVCAKKGMPLVCTEFGVIGTVPENYRNRYLKDILSIFDKLNIPSQVWDLDQRFAVLDANGDLLKSISKWLGTL